MGSPSLWNGTASGIDIPLSGHGCFPHPYSGPPVGVIYTGSEPLLFLPFATLPIQFGISYLCMLPSACILFTLPPPMHLPPATSSSFIHMLLRSALYGLGFSPCSYPFLPRCFVCVCVYQKLIIYFVPSFPRVLSHMHMFSISPIRKLKPKCDPKLWEHFISECESVDLYLTNLMGLCPRWAIVGGADNAAIVSMSWSAWCLCASTLDPIL
jgi:hypothetical protein